MTLLARTAVLYHGAAFGLGQGHHLGIGERDPARMVGDGQDVVPPVAEFARDGGGQHLIQQQPHGLMASCPADQAAWASAACCSLASINGTFLAGGTVVLMRRFSPGEALGPMGEHRATMFEASGLTD